MSVMGCFYFYKTLCWTQIHESISVTTYYGQMAWTWFILYVDADLLSTDHDYYSVTKILNPFLFQIRTCHYFSMCPVCRGTFVSPIKGTIRAKWNSNNMSGNRTVPKGSIIQFQSLESKSSYFLKIIVKRYLLSTHPGLGEDPVWKDPWHPLKVWSL
jgi:hypothetical protein